MVLVEQVFYFLFYHSGVHARLRNHGDVADPTRLVEGVAKRAVGYVNGFSSSAALSPVARELNVPTTVKFTPLMLMLCPIGSSHGSNNTCCTPRPTTAIFRRSSQSSWLIKRPLEISSECKLAIPGWAPRTEQRRVGKKCRS